jgi:small subunit ribosomal protein S13
MGYDKYKQVGSLSVDEVKKIEDVIKNPLKYKIPNFILNRRKDYDTGEDKHLTAADLKLITGFDIKRFKKIRSYKGIRHAMGKPVRGQRTKGHFRHGKTVGVRKKGIQAQVKEEKKK